MPLNLWFYNYQELITVKDGHLWLAALVCCALYAVSASLLRDRAFVYVLVGGVALTGLLMLADVRLLHDDLFWQISAPATFLVCLGLACIHAERAFPEGEGPFSRRRFGLAFFWSGHVALGVGLLLILGAQVTGDLFRDLFHSLFAYPLPGGLKLEQPSGVLEASGRLLALGLIAAATYAYAYSDLVVRRVGVYIHLAVVCFLWAELSLLRWMDGPPEAFLIALALTGLLANFALTALLPPTSTLRRTGPALALGLCGLPLLIGLMMHFEAVASVPAAHTRAELVVCGRPGAHRRRLPRRGLPAPGRPALAGKHVPLRHGRGVATRGGRPAHDPQSGYGMEATGAGPDADPARLPGRGPPLPRRRPRNAGRLGGPCGDGGPDRFLPGRRLPGVRPATQPIAEPPFGGLFR